MQKLNTEFLLRKLRRSKMKKNSAQNKNPKDMTPEEYVQYLFGVGLEVSKFFKVD